MFINCRFYELFKVINKVGNFDENFKIRSDYDMTISIMSTSKKYYSFLNSVGAFREGGVSGSYSSYFESFYILRKHGISIFKCILNILPSFVKVFVINIFPSSIIKFLRKTFSSGRFVKF